LAAASAALSLFPNCSTAERSVLYTEMAHSCIYAGAKVITTEGFDSHVVEFAVKGDTVVFPGAMTPTEVLRAWKAGCDFVKVFPCAQIGGDSYIRALKARLPRVPLIAAGGVNQQMAADFTLAGVVALKVGGDLIPRDSILLRQSERIRERARRFVGTVKSARADIASRKVRHPPQSNDTWPG
jgi:2-dehydro-3-deoxyphosphogluconate aldolase / (4S)-4-hydroxy-2-oxoglutarate aldolase